jgi:RNA polymerase sigma factor (TIGR02999 family)
VPARELGSTDSGATDALFAAVYDELKRISRRQLRATDANSALSTTELVHEAFLKLADRTEKGWEGRAHFFGAAARAMRQILVDFARRRRAGKRGGEWRVVTLRDADVALEIELDQVLALDDALEQLDAANPRLRRVVELRFFAGLSEQEIAHMLGVSARTVERDWLKARLFLMRALETDSTQKS